MGPVREGPQPPPASPPQSLLLAVGVVGPSWGEAQTLGMVLCAFSRTSSLFHVNLTSVPHFTVYKVLLQPSSPLTLPKTQQRKMILITVSSQMGANAQEVARLAQGLETEPGLTVRSPGPRSHAPF